MQAYDLLQSDSRTFGDLIQRVVRELHRPDLQGQAQDFARDAIRYWSRKPFFFTELDNTDIGGWEASLYVPYGTTIRETADDANSYIFVALTSGSNGSVIPTFTSQLFTIAPQPGPVFTVGQTGTTVDNGITWATIQAWPDSLGPANKIWTELTTIPTINQIIPPIDYVAPTIVELTAANLRYRLDWESYPSLRAKDVIRPAPITVYPTEATFYKGVLYCWPYPSGFFPVTLSYNTAPFAPRSMTTSNFWTTIAESLVRCYTKHLIQAQVIYDGEAATMEFGNAQREFVDLRDQEREQQGAGGIPPSDW